MKDFACTLDAVLRGFLAARRPEASKKTGFSAMLYSSCSPARWG